MEVVFVLDTTGSMSGMIAGAKQKIWAIANKLKSAQPTPEIRFGSWVTATGATPTSRRCSA